MNIVTIIYNEAPYLKEWIEFHLAQGFQKFYIYDNDSTDSPLDVLAKYMDTGIVSYIRWPIVPGQIAAYQDFINKNKHLETLTAFIDLDEFIVGEIPKDADGVLLNWYLFGSNGHEHYVDLPVTQRFTKRQKKINPHVKSIIRPNKFIGPLIDPHYIPVQGLIVDGNGTKIEKPTPLYTPKKKTLKCRIHHYVVKSKEECHKKCTRPRADSGEIRDFLWYFKEHDCNEVTDESASNTYNRNREQA
jgi:hypothetical protein